MVEENVLILLTLLKIFINETSGLNEPVDSIILDSTRSQLYSKHKGVIKETELFRKGNPGSIQRESPRNEEEQ